MDMWPRFAQELGLDIGLHWGGELRWESHAEGVKDLQERVAQLQAWGYPSRLIEAAEVRQLEPQLVTGPIAAAAFGAMDGQVEPSKTVAACLQRAQESGAMVQSNTAVTGFQTTPAHTSTRRIQAVRTSQGDVPCDAVVLAAGIDTTALAAMVGVHVPQQESPGVVIRTAASGARVTPCLGTPHPTYRCQSPGDPPAPGHRWYSHDWAGDAGEFKP